MIQAADDDNSHTTASGSRNLLGEVHRSRRLESLRGYTRKFIYAVPKHEFRQFPKLAKPQVVSASTESSCGKSLSFDSIGHWTA